MSNDVPLLTDLDQRAAQVPIVEQLERVPADARMWYEHDSASHSHIPVGRMCSEAARLIREQAAEIERLRMCLYDEQDGITGTLRTDEIERLRARVAELESMAGLSSREVDRLTALILKAHAEDQRMNAIAQNGNDGLHYREVGPTPLRGRVTRRD